MSRPKRNRTAEDKAAWQTIQLWKQKIAREFANQATTQELMDVAYQPAEKRRTH